MDKQGSNDLSRREGFGGSKPRPPKPKPTKPKGLPNKPIMDGGAYDPEQLGLYLAKCVDRGITTERMARHLNVPPHRVEMFLQKLGELPNPDLPMKAAPRADQVTITLTPSELEDYKTFRSSGFTKREAFGYIFKDIAK